MIGLFCGKGRIKPRHPMGLRHPVSTVFIAHFPQKSPVISGSFAESIQPNTSATLISCDIIFVT